MVTLFMIAIYFNKILFDLDLDTLSDGYVLQDKKSAK